jgi:hypothetical protein
LATEFYAGSDLAPSKLDISAIRSLLVLEHLTEEQVRNLIVINKSDGNLKYWRSPAAWVKHISGGSKPVWRHLLEIGAANRMTTGNMEGLPF